MTTDAGPILPPNRDPDERTVTGHPSRPVTATFPDGTPVRDARDAAFATFAAHVWGGVRGFLCVGVGTRRADGKLHPFTQKFYPYPASVVAAWGWIRREADAGKDTLVGAHLVRDKQRGKPHAGDVHTLWADVDTAPVPTGDLAPTLVVVTSEGRWHGYWRLREPVAPEVAEALNRRLALAIGADSGWALSKLLRPPETTNFKYPDHPQTRIRDGPSARVYDVADLDRLLPIVPAGAVPPPAATGERPVSGPADVPPPVRLRGAGLAVWRGERPTMRRDDPGEIDRSRSLYRIGCVLCEAGATKPTIRAAVAERDAALEWGAYTDRPSEYDRLADKVEADVTARAQTGAAPIGGDPVADAAGEHATDLGNARRLVRAHGADLRYCAPLGGWFAWDGARWRHDDTGEVVRRAKDTVGAIYAEASGQEDDKERAALVKHGLKSEGDVRLRAMVALAESEPGVPLAPEAFDRDPDLLTVANGTLDLRTGVLGPHRREDLITRLCPVAYDAAAVCPAWLAFLDAVFEGDAALIDFVQRAAGYSLTGRTGERVLFLLHGGGRNGKTTLLEVLGAVFGPDYATRTPTETLLLHPGGGGIPNDVARLRGVRLVGAAEADEGRRLAEGTVKNLTGGDTVPARFLHREWFTFVPVCKFWFATNHRPEVRGSDDAIWDRLRPIPFAVRFWDEGQGETGPADRRADKDLRGRLLAEAPGILAWAVRGAVAWYAGGLGYPPAVREAATGYRAEMDAVGRFLEDCCLAVDGVWTATKVLYAAYADWARENGETPLVNKEFGKRLGEHGYTAQKQKPGRGWIGLALADQPAQRAYHTAPAADDGGHVDMR